MSSSSNLEKYVERVDDEGPITVWICKFCHGRVSPMYFTYHLESKHPEVSGKKPAQQAPS